MDHLDSNDMAAGSRAEQGEETSVSGVNGSQGTGESSEGGMALTAVETFERHLSLERGLSHRGMHQRLFRGPEARADDHTVGSQHSLHAPCVGVWSVAGVDRRAVLRGECRRIDDVLDADG